MRLDGLIVKNYRSFDSDGIILDDLGKINIFIGKNNAGKSNVLSIIEKLDRAFNLDNNTVLFSKKDYHNYSEKDPIEFWIKYAEGSMLDKLKISLANERRRNALTNLLNTAMIWQRFSSNKEAKEKEMYFPVFDDKSWLFERLPRSQENLKNILIEFLGQSPTFPELEKSALNIFDSISVIFNVPHNSIFHVGVFRKIDVDGSGFEKTSRTHLNRTFNGRNLIKELDQLKNPKAENREQRQKFNKVERFIQDILNNKNITINISESNDELQLEDRSTGSLDALENLGTGIHQLVLLAISATQNENKIICIEEPEIYLHPEMQKKFISYLRDQTNNQYFITTHSNSFINIEGIDIYHLMHDSKKSIVKKVLSASAKSVILDDLGYHASDILQTNFLIWVEGPSDRIYLNHWIRNKYSDFIEGIHYSIMFYGGRLLSHLSAGSEEIDDFIRLNKINRNIAILIDSDKNDPSDTLRDTKTRIIDEFNKEGYFYWVTAGREIENYLDISVITTLAKDFRELNIETNSNPFHKRTKTGDNSIDKVALAKKIIEEPANYSILDLEEKITELVTRIKKANNL